VILQSMLDAREEGLQRGAAEVLDKPVNRRRLAGTLERLAPRDRAGHVLLIECASEAREALVAALRARGWFVSSSEQSGEALALARQYLPDLILLSLGLPSEDVFALAEELGRSEVLRRVPVYVLEGSEPATDARLRLESHLDRLVLAGETGIEAVLAETGRLAGPQASAAGTDA
jgi:CheY-like chemotaxis protein